MEKNIVTIEELLNKYDFKKIGSFYLENNELNYNINSEYKNIKDIVYLLKTETENLYLGLSESSIKDVLYKFKQGSKSQVTNHNIKNKLIEKLKEIKSIDIVICQISDTISIDTKNISWNGQDFKKINNTEKINEIIQEQNKKLLENFYHNRIIYGTPGTGKSYKLKQEIETNFKNIEKENEFISTEDRFLDINNITCWSGGFIISDRDEKESFFENSEWRTNNDNIKTKIINEVKEGDLIFLKSTFTKKTIKGDFLSNKKEGEAYSISRVFAIGKILKNLKNGTKLKVQWYRIKDKEFIDYPTVYLRGTLNRVLKYKNKILEDWINLLDNNSGKEIIKQKETISTVERVTFYDGYTYGQFVGTYKPTPTIKEDGTETITYKYVPGPFMKQLVKAYNDEENDYCLVIEEINRAKADRVFGNIFQLLDRDKGKSEYPIAASEDQLIYLKENLIEEKFNKVLEEGLYIPKNLYLWATMNSADQGVYPMDSAFKRRWSFEHIGLNENEYEKLDDGNIPGICFREENETKHIVSWNNFRKVINETLLENKVLEDRLLAPYFIKKESFNETLGSVSLLNETVFIDKILMYLFDDILKHKNNNILFKEGINSFSQIKDILKEYPIDRKEVTIFNDKIINQLTEKVIKSDEIFIKEQMESNVLIDGKERGNTLYKNFWESLNEYLNSNDKKYYIFSNKSRTPSTDNWQERQIPNVFGYEVVLKLSYTKKIVSTEIYMNKENAKSLFNKVYSHKEEIEKSLGFNLQWFNKEENQKVAYKAYLSKELDISNKELWEEAFAWLIENSEKMARAFEIYI